jgi:hypothetical protein
MLELGSLPDPKHHGITAKQNGGHRHPMGSRCFEVQTKRLIGVATTWVVFEVAGGER